MKVFTSILCIMIFFVAALSNAQTADSCLKLLRTPEALDANPDSVKADSCIGSPTYGDLYAKGWFHVEFRYHLLSTPIGPADTIIDRSWHDIDSQFVFVRNAFDSIEQLFGSFILRKQQPHWADTSSRGDNIFSVRFDNCVDIGSATMKIKSIPLVIFSGYDMRVITKAYITRKHIQSKFDYLRIFISRSSKDYFPISVKDFLSIGGNFEIFDIIGNRIYSLQSKESEIQKLIPTIINLPNGMYTLNKGIHNMQVVISD